MSIILGYKTENKICLSSDKRLTDMVKGSYSDDATKMIVLNEHLAMACSGSRMAQDCFNNFIRKSNLSKWTIEDVIFKLDAMCSWFKIAKVEEVNKLGAYFIIGGLSTSGEISLYSASYNHKKFSYGKDVELAIYPPSDLDIQNCCNIYIPNFHKHFFNCMQRTVKEVSALSKMVSPSGDIWTYDIELGCSSMEHFD